MNISLIVALIAFIGVLITGLIAVYNAWKSGEQGKELVELRAKIDHINSLELAKRQAEFANRLNKIEFRRKQDKEREDRHRSADNEVLEHITSLLPSDTIISFLRSHDFRGTFDRNNIDALHSFIGMSSRPDFEFLNPDLEKHRKHLLTKAKSLSKELGAKTFPRSKGTFSSVLPDEYMGLERPEWVNQNAEQINRYADEFVTSYDELIRSARTIV